jgi:hypothetical protein
MSAKIGPAQRGLVILTKIDGKELHWLSANRIVIVTRQGASFTPQV